MPLKSSMEVLKNLNGLKSSTEASEAQEPEWKIEERRQTTMSEELLIKDYASFIIFSMNLYVFLNMFCGVILMYSLTYRMEYCTILTNQKYTLN